MREPKFGANGSWLFGLGTLVVAIAASLIVPHVAHLSPKAMAAVYTIIFGAGATGAAVLTRSTTFGVMGPFALASVGIGVCSYILAARAAAEIASSGFGSLGAAASGGIGAMAGVVFAIAYFLVGLAGSLAGALFGRKLKVGAPKPLFQR